MSGLHNLDWLDLCFLASPTALSISHRVPACGSPSFALRVGETKTTSRFGPPEAVVKSLANCLNSSIFALQSTAASVPSPAQNRLLGSASQFGAKSDDQEGPIQSSEITNKGICIVGEIPHDKLFKHIHWIFRYPFERHRILTRCKANSLVGCKSETQTSDSNP